ncbi:MAG: TAXI family TRAP transporter solute-binding subunit [Hyphomicrobiaceae bacterium]|nr:TAXI family TRAP transporter solute-binding subunit [Hyphomicrobiaceae bacterium]
MVTALAIGTALPAAAQQVKLPQTLTMTAYDTGTSGFNISVAVGKMLKEKYGTDVRVLPAGNDVARLAPLKGNRAQVSAMGIGIYFAQEGVLEFATKEWGPQALQLLIASNDCNGLAMAVAKDTGVKEMKDLKGKKIAIVVGSPALTQNALALLAFGGLTAADVKLVEFASNAAMFKGMLNNEADAAATSTINPLAREVETSPRGLVWPATPHSDDAGWARLRKFGPYFAKHKATCGAAGLSPTSPVELPAYPYPLYMGYSTLSADLAHSLTKAMIDGYDAYKDGAPGAAGLALKAQNLKWAVPFHPGAAKAYKEAGVWTDAEEAHNKALLDRQKVLADAWAAFSKADQPADKEAFRKAWMAARKNALEAAKMNVVFE